MNRKTSLFGALVVGTLLNGAAMADQADVVSGTVVAVNTSSHTVTLKSDSGQTSTTPLEGPALSEIGRVEPGQTVAATFRDSPSGHHEAITSLTIFRTVKVFADQ